VMEGTIVPVVVSASDDLIVDAVSLYAGGRLFTSTKARSGTISYRVPRGAATIQLLARAGDFGTGTADSLPITLNVVEDAAAPTVRITSPAQGSSLVGNQQIQVTADATDDGAVATVEFFVNGVSIGTDTTAPYQVAYFVPQGGGTLTFTAKATDGAGKSTTSAPVTATVQGDQAPRVTMRTPVTAGIYAGGDLLVSADATDDAGIYYVQYIIDGVVQRNGYSYNAPYEVWLQLPPGEAAVRLRAQAYDRTGHSTLSDEITIQVRPTAALSTLSLAGFPVAMAMQGPYAYVAASGAGLLVVDAADPAAPILAGSLTLPGKTVGIRVSGRYAFAVSDTGGLRVIDVSDPHHPVGIAAIPIAAACTSVSLDAEKAFVTAADGVHVFDVRNPLAPQPLSFLPTSRTADQALAAGDRLYVSQQFPAVRNTDCHSCALIRAYDLSTPTAPRELGSVKAQTYSREYDDKITTKLALHNGYLYVGGTDYLSAIDISDPAAMHEVGLFDDTQYLHCCWHDLKLNGNIAFSAGWDSPAVQMLDVTDPEGVTMIGKVDFKAFDSRYVGAAVAVTPELVFSAGSDSHIYSATRHRFVAGRYNTIHDNLPVRPVVTIAHPLAGATVFEQQLVSIDVNATDDVAVASVQVSIDGQPVATLTAAPYSFLWNVPAGVTQHVVTALATDFGGNTATAVPVAFNAVADVTPPTVQITAPARGVSVPSSTVTLRASAADDFSVTSVAFTVNGLPAGVATVPPYQVEYTVPAGMTAFTVGATATDQAGNTASAGTVTVTIVAPRIVGSLALPGRARQVAVNGNLAFVAAAPGGLHIVDISNPAAPVLVTTVALGDCYDVRLSGQYAYVMSPSQFRLLDVSTPSAPVVVSTLQVTGIGLDLIGTHALVAGGGSMADVDLSDPAAPRLVSQGTQGNGSISKVRTAQGRYAMAIAFDGFSHSSLVMAYDTTVPLNLFPVTGFSELDGNLVVHSTFNDISVDGSLVALATTAGLSLTNFTSSFVGDVRYADALGFSSVAQQDGWLLAGHSGTNDAVLFDVSDRLTAVPRATLDTSAIATAQAHSAVAVTPALAFLTTAAGDGSASTLVAATYRTFNDALGIAPAVSVQAAGPATTGRMLHLSAVATDDIGVAAVTFTVNGTDVFTDTVAPYELNYRVPAGTHTPAAIGARAVDFGGNTANAAEVTIPVN